MEERQHGSTWAQELSLAISGRDLADFASFVPNEVADLLNACFHNLGRSAAEPLLDIVAQYKKSGYTIRILVGGTAAKPSLGMESDPYLEQAGILSVILFGKPSSELGGGQSEVLKEQAIGVAASYATADLRKSVAGSLGLDDLQVEPGGSDMKEAKITAGEYVAEDIFVSLSQKFGQQAVQELRVQYFMTPRWTLETNTDTLGDSGADVFWRLRY